MIPLRRAIAVVLVCLSSSAARDLAPLAAPEPEPSTPTLTIDTWQPKGPVRRPPPPPEPEEPSPAPPVSIKEAPRADKKARPAPETAAAPRVAMNEMSGTISSLESNSLRLAVEGGINVHFDFANNLTVLSGGKQRPVNELKHGDAVVIRYVGRDLIAREIEKRPAR